MLEKLAKQTAVYGISTIVVRFLSYLLTPYYTRVFGQETYGVVTDIYALIPLALTLLTMGMESSYFRFSAKAEEAAPEKKGLFKKSSDASASSDSGKPAKKAEEKPKKKRFQFLRDVKAEMKRVTWPTRTDVLRWSGVVVVALLFFGIFVAILDNAIITPLLVLISGISLG